MCVLSSLSVYIRCQILHWFEYWELCLAIPIELIYTRAITPIFQNHLLMCSYMCVQACFAIKSWRQLYSIRSRRIDLAAYNTGVCAYIENIHYTFDNIGMAPPIHTIHALISSRTIIMPAFFIALFCRCFLINRNHLNQVADGP